MKSINQNMAKAILLAFEASASEGNFTFVDEPDASEARLPAINWARSVLGLEMLSSDPGYGYMNEEDDAL